MDNLNQPTIPNYVLEPSTLEYMWNLADKGILKYKKINGEYFFRVSSKHIDKKDKIIRNHEELLDKLTNFYLDSIKHRA